jgi:hypothetical protein
MKKLKKVLFFVFVMLLWGVKVEALSVDKDTLNIAKGKSEEVNLYANVDEKVTSIEFTLVYTTYDVSASFKVNPDFTYNQLSSIKHQISFSTPQSGKINLGTITVSTSDNPSETTGRININNGSATSESGKTINLNSETITVTIGEETEEVTDNNEENNTSALVKKETNLLKKIESKLVTVELKDDVFEYNVNVSEDVEELDLKPILKDDSYKVEVSSQKISELKDNKILITVSKGDEKVVYTINVKVTKEIDIDTEKFVSSSDYKNKWIIIIAVLAIMLVVGLLLGKKKK